MYMSGNRIRAHTSTESGTPLSAGRITTITPGAGYLLGSRWFGRVFRSRVFTPTTVYAGESGGQGALFF